MEGGALLDDKMAEFAKDYVLFCHVTSKVTGAKHPDLLAEKGGRGFPHLVFLDAEGQVAGVHTDWKNRTADGFAATGKLVKSVPALKAKAATDPAADFELFSAQLKLGLLDAAKTKERIAGLKDLTPEQKGVVAGVQANFEVEDAIKTLPRAATAEQRGELGAKFLEMHKAGRIPSDEMRIQTFYIFIMDHAEAKKDIPSFELALAALKAKFGDNAQAAKFFEDRENRLKKLKDAKDAK